MSDISLKEDLLSSLLYINVFTPPNSFKWFALDPNSKTLSPLPPIPSKSSDGSACVVLGHKIFVLGGSNHGNPSSQVWIFDTRLNKWEAGPPMTAARKFFAAGVIQGKIYVFSGWFSGTGAQEFDPDEEFDSDEEFESWAEVFDPMVGSWADVPSPRFDDDNQDKWIYSSVVLEDKLYAVEDDGVIVFDPVGSPSQWSFGTTKALESGWTGKSTVVDGVLYNFDLYGKLQGYDEKENRWKELIGVELKSPPLGLAAVGGKLFAVWKGKSTGEREVEILCAEVEVCELGSGELRGSIVWSDVIMSVPSRSLISHCFGVGV